MQASCQRVILNGLGGHLEVGCNELFYPPLDGSQPFSKYDPLGRGLVPRQLWLKRPLCGGHQLINLTHRGLDFLVDDGTLDKDLLSVGLVDFHVVILGARLRDVAQRALLQLMNLDEFGSAADSVFRFICA